MNAATTQSRRDQFASKIERLINDSPKSQAELAHEMGYANQNIITMFKKGTTRVPLDRVASLARALDVDAGTMMKEWFETYMPGVVADLDANMGTLLTRNERTWLDGLRRSFRHVPPFSEEMKAAVKQAARAPVAVD